MFLMLFNNEADIQPFCIHLDYILLLQINTILKEQFFIFHV